jgi:hypothetical protein
MTPTSSAMQAYLLENVLNLERLQPHVGVVIGSEGRALHALDTALLGADRLRGPFSH